MSDKKILIVGMGNPLLGDDRAGWVIAEQLEIFLSTHSELTVEIDQLSLGGLSLMERMEGYDWAILLDAITTGQNPIGTVTCFPLESLSNPSAGHLGSAHDTTLQTAIAFGRSMGLKLPDLVSVVAIEATVNLDITQELSPAVVAAIPDAVKAVAELLLKAGLLQADQSSKETTTL